MVWLWLAYGLVLTSLYLLVFGERLGIGPWSGKDDYMLLLFGGLKFTFGFEIMNSDLMQDGFDQIRVTRGWKGVIGIVGLAAVVDITLMMLSWNLTRWVLDWIGIQNSVLAFLAIAITALILPTLVGYGIIRAGFSAETERDTEDLGTV